MRPIHLLINFPVLLLAACSSSTPPPPTVDAPQIPAPVIIKQDFSKILDSNFRGQFYYDDSQAYFQGCNAEQPIAVHNNDKITRIYQQITANSTVPVYVEFAGEIAFAKHRTDDSDAVMRIDMLHHMALAKTSLQCAKPISNSLLQAKGEDPYWRLNIDGQNLYFATKARNQVYQINKANFQTTQMNSVQSINKQDERLDLVIEPNECFNLKDNEYWGYTAKVSSIWGSFTGCGEPGWPRIDEKISGYYLNETPTKTTNIILNADNTVEYSEKTAQETLLKTGFWKNNTPDTLVVMLTQQAGNNIRQELVFTRNELSLSSEQLNNNNIIEKFASPLVFKKMNLKEGIEDTAATSIIRNFTPALIKPERMVDVDIQAAVNRYFKIHRTDPQNTNFSSVTYDLNGDDIKEAVVLLDWCSKSGCEMLIFEGTADGYRFSSRVSQVNAPIIIAKDQHFLWQSLLVDKAGQTFKLDFDGLSYPINANNSATADKQYESTKVLLFSQGTPRQWFPIQP